MHTSRKYYEELTKEFKPLLRNLSGVNQMVILTKNDQKILFIGETHQNQFCSKQGFEPIARHVEDFLYNGDNVDFMIEYENATRYFSANTYKKRTMTLKKVRSITHDGKGNKKRRPAVITLTRHLVDRFIPKKQKYELRNSEMDRFDPTKDTTKFEKRNEFLNNARVHWLDPSKIEKVETKGDMLVNLFYQHVNAYSGGHVTKTDMLKINKVLDLDPVQIPFAVQENGNNVTLDHLMTSFTQSTMNSRRAFFNVCLDHLSDSKHFRKCFRERRLDRQICEDVFFEDVDADATVRKFYFLIQRFFMDIYTCCRIMKRDANHERWYKTIVVYEGGAHVDNQVKMLLRNGYVRHEVVGVKYNPKCV